MNTHTMLQPTFSWARIALAGTVAVITFFFGISMAHAQQESAGVSIQPAIVELRTDPGGTEEGNIRITNLSDRDQTFFLYTRDIIDVTASNAPVFTKREEVSELDFSQWINLSEIEVSLAPRETAQVGYRVIVPENAPPGGHFAGVLASVVSPEDMNQVGASVGYEVSSIFTLRVDGDVMEEASITEFSTDKLIYTGANVTFTTTIANDGNVLVVPRGVIEVTDMFGANVGNFEVNEASGRVFPGRERTYQSLWSEPGFKFGRYEAILTVDYGADQRRNMSATMSFWILPMNVIMPIVLGLLAILVLAYIAMSFHVKRRIRQIEKTTGGRGRVVHERAPMSGIMVAAIVLLVFAIIFLMALFVMFA